MSPGNKEHDLSQPQEGGGNMSTQYDAAQLIGDKLKNMYEDVVNEAVPDRFTSLLEQLDQAEKNRGV